jgi:hypothetical protein
MESTQRRIDTLWNERHIGDGINIYLTAFFIPDFKMGFIEISASLYVSRDNEHAPSSTWKVDLIAINDGDYKSTIIRSMEVWRDNLDDYVTMGIEAGNKKAK